MAQAPARPVAARPLTPARPRVEEPDDPPRRLREDDEDDRPRRSRRDRDEEDEDERPRRRSGRRKSSSRGMLLIFGAIGGAILLLCCGGGGWLIYSYQSPMSFSESSWHEHTLPDGSASVQCPVVMKPEFMPNPGGGVTISKDLWDASGFQDAAFAFGVIDCPLGHPFTLDSVYQVERDEVIRATNARVVTEKTMTVQGHLAKEFEFASGRASAVYRLVYVREPTRKRFVIIMAGGRNMSVTDRAKFIESFRLKPRK